jgi:hypothetical protein
LLKSFFGKIGVASLVTSAFSLPLVSYFANQIWLAVPFYLFSTSGFAEHTFFLVGSIVYVVAVARVFDFVLSGLSSSIVEAINFLKASSKINRKTLSEIAIARYEMAVLRASGKVSRELISVEKHLRVSAFLSLYSYWWLFLDHQFSVFYLVLVFFIYVIAVTGLESRRAYVELYESRKRMLERFYTMVANTRRIQGLVKTKSASEYVSVPLYKETLQEAERELATIEAENSRLLDEIRRIRYLSIAPHVLIKSLKNRLRPAAILSIEYPIGIVSLAIAVAIYLGIARANVILESSPAVITTDGHTVCGRIISKTSDVYLVELIDEDVGLLLVPKERVNQVLLSEECK